MADTAPSLPLLIDGFCLSTLLLAVAAWRLLSSLTFASFVM
jgi:hypothetical protein